MLPFGNLRQTSWRKDVGACSACGANPQRCTWRSWMRLTAEVAVAQPGLPRSHLILRSARHHPPALRLERAVQRSVRVVGGRLARYPPLARSQQLGRAISAGRSHRRVAGSLRPIASCRWKATACTRSRSVPCTRELSSPDISGLPQAARPWSGWNSGWDIPTRASRGS